MAQAKEGWRSPADIIGGELLRNERLLWADRPASVRMHALKSVPIMLFGVPFLAFALFWTFAAASMGSATQGPIAFFDTVKHP